MEVVVVDNDSKDGSAEMVESEFPTAKLILPGKNTGYAAGNNIAFANASGDWLLTLNPDTEVFPATLQAAVDKLKANPTYGSLGIRQIGLEGETQRSVRGFPGFWGVFGDLSGLGKVFKGSKLDSYRLRAFNYDKEQAAPQPMGTFLLFRKAAIEKVGDPKHPFDEAFPIFFNEVDLLFRLKNAGWPCLYTPDVQIKHVGGMSTKQVKKSMVWESHRSLMRFFEKHYKTPLTAPFLPLLKGLVYFGAWIRARGYDVGFKS
jgi:GT2 family glycosyltransferase